MVKFQICRLDAVRRAEEFRQDLAVTPVTYKMLVAPDAWAEAFQLYIVYCPTRFA